MDFPYPPRALLAQPIRCSLIFYHPYDEKYDILGFSVIELGDKMTFRGFFFSIFMVEATHETRKISLSPVSYVFFFSLPLVFQKGMYVLPKRRSNS
jgi:hypothetical protein